MANESWVVETVPGMLEARTAPSDVERFGRHPSVPTRPLPLVRSTESGEARPFDDGCGSGLWCDDCREEIRLEALTWIQDLNSSSRDARPGLSQIEVRRILGKGVVRP